MSDYPAELNFKASDDSHNKAAIEELQSLLSVPLRNFVEWLDVMVDHQSNPFSEDIESIPRLEQIAWLWWWNQQSFEISSWGKVNIWQEGDEPANVRRSGISQSESTLLMRYHSYIQGACLCGIPAEEIVMPKIKTFLVDFIKKD